MKRKYVSIGKPIGFKIFDEWKKPTGWIRLEYLTSQKSKRYYSR